MKNIFKNSNAKNDVFTKFSTIAISKDQQKQLKGGDGDSIIIEELVQI